MPITKLRLTKAEQAKHLACLKELRAAGIDVDIPSQTLLDGCPLKISVYGGLSSRVVEGSTGGIYYAIWVRMVARRAHLILLSCMIETPWDDQIELQSFQLRESILRLGGLQYPAKEVLNDRIENCLRFNYRGALVEGVILFSGLSRIPDCYCEGMSVPFKLTFLDQFEEEISVEAELLIDGMRKPKSGDERPRIGLYAPQAQSSIKR